VDAEAKLKLCRRRIEALEREVAQPHAAADLASRGGARYAQPVRRAPSPRRPSGSGASAFAPHAAASAASASASAASAPPAGRATSAALEGGAPQEWGRQHGASEGGGDAAADIAAGARLTASPRLTARLSSTAFLPLRFLPLLPLSHPLPPSLLASAPLLMPPLLMPPLLPAAPPPRGLRLDPGLGVAASRGDGEEAAAELVC